jgi:hypothetical protein
VIATGANQTAAQMRARRSAYRVHLRDLVQLFCLLCLKDVPELRTAFLAPKRFLLWLAFRSLLQGKNAGNTLLLPPPSVQ